MPTDSSTLTLIISGVTAIGSLLVATATISRRSKAWDSAEKLQKVVLDGEPENDKKSLVQRVKESEELGAQTAQQLRWVKRALSAHGSDEIVIAEAVKAYVDKHAKTEAEAVVRAAFAEYLQMHHPQGYLPPQHHPQQSIITPIPHRALQQNPSHQSYPSKKSIPREESDDDTDDPRRRR